MTRPPLTRAEMKNTDFTLYFLAFDHGDGLSPEEKKNTRFSREGARSTCCSSRNAID